MARQYTVDPSLLQAIDVNPSDLTPIQEATPPSGATAGMLPPSGVSEPVASEPSSLQRLLQAVGEGEMNQAEALRQVPDLASDVAVGGAKGAANTLIGMGELANRVPGVSHLNSAINGPVSDATYDAARQEFATPTTDAQRIGFGAEQVGEFVMLPQAKGGLVRRALTEGVQSGGLTAAQGGDPRAIALSILPGAAVPMASHAAPALAGPLRESAGRNVSQALNPTTNRMKRMTEQVTPKMLERGTYAMSRQGLADKAGRELEALGGKFDEATAALPAGDRLSTQPIRDRIQSEMQSLIEKGSSGKPVPRNPQKYQALQELDQTIADLGDKVSRETMQAFKEEWMEAVATGGGYAERTGDDLTRANLWAKRHGADAIRRELAKDSPSIDALNSEWSFWTKVQEITETTLGRERPQKGAMRRLAGLFGGLAGSAQGGVQGAVIGAGLGSQVMRAFDSPGWKLASAHAKNSLADALASGNSDRVSTALGRVVASMPAQSRPMQPVPSH